VASELIEERIDLGDHPFGGHEESNERDRLVGLDPEDGSSVGVLIYSPSPDLL
jgi:hypothetical protein